MGRIDFSAINAAALQCFDSLLREWLPDGHKDGPEYKSLNPTRADSRAGSFSINVVKGVWQDFATDDKGSDPVSLYAYLFHGNDQGAAAKELGDRLGVRSPGSTAPARSASAQPAPSAPAKGQRSPWSAVTPPVSADEPPMAHSRRGIPEKVWCYRGAAGEALGFIYRFRTSDGGKEVLPVSWCRNSDTGAEEWRWMAFAEPRWLYGLDRLAALPNATVLVTEGEKCADAAAGELPELACVTWPGGSKAVDKADWTRLAGRKVIIWPDCDAQTDKEGALLPEDKQPGMLAAEKIAAKLLALGCKVWIVKIPAPGEKPSGWDIADAIEDGMTGDALREFLRTDVRLLAPAADSADAPPAGDLEGISTPPPAGAGRKKHRPRADWESGLIQKPRGGLEDCRENVFLVLSRHPEWDGVIGYNDFSQRIEKRQAPPFGGKPGEWTSQDDYDLGLWLAQNCDLLIKGEGTLTSGVAMTANRNKFHPVRDWMNALPAWDNIERLPHWLIECMGCEDKTFVRLAGEFFLIGMVARIFQPGCAMQYMPIFEGAQGKGKSTALRVLGGDWFAETPFKLGDKDAYMQLNGAILYEVSEMDSFNKAETTAVKAFVTIQTDRYREPYARRPVDRPRQCVFAGTTNHGEYFKDTTGNRRFWPLRVTNIDLQKLAEWREQLFAEALHKYRAGNRWHPTRDEERLYFFPEQEEREIVDPWLYPLQDWLDDPARRVTKEFTSKDILVGAFEVELSKVDGNRGMATRLGNLLAKLGWGKGRRPTGKREWVYLRPAPAAPAGTTTKEEADDPVGF